jgi:hypothetical protein
MRQRRVQVQAPRARVRCERSEPVEAPKRVRSQVSRDAAATLRKIEEQI